jgi:transposase
MAPGLTDRRGIGAVTAAQACHSPTPDGAEATPRSPRCQRTSPLPASSGRTDRHRLNRGGDRALNSAIHTIAITRIRCCATTKNYVARRTAEGKSSREIQRCLKRYIARELYRALNTSTTLTDQTSPAPAAA